MKTKTQELKAIYVFLPIFQSKAIREKLSMFAGNYILNRKKVWKLEVPANEFNTAINGVEYALAGNNVYIEKLENSALFTF